MSKSDPPNTQTAEFVIPTEADAKTLVCTIMEHRAFCWNCLAPLEVSPQVQFPGEPEPETLKTSRTFTEYGDPIDVYPPGEKSERTVCGNCGEIDYSPDYSRDKETDHQALEHLLSILDENGVTSMPVVARAVVNEYHDNGHTGQFCEMLGNAIHQSTLEP